MKYSPLIAAIIGAVLLVAQQYMGDKEADLKVVGFAALIAAIGAASLFLKGKGSTLLGIIGTVGYTFYQIWQTGEFTWNTFILTSVVAVLTLISPSFVPEPEPKP
jgi:hypothetical protein